jgi:hypothetical protein
LRRVITHAGFLTSFKHSNYRFHDTQIDDPDVTVVRPSPEMIGSEATDATNEKDRTEAPSRSH